MRKLQTDTYNPAAFLPPTSIQSKTQSKTQSQVDCGSQNGGSYLLPLQNLDAAIGSIATSAGDRYPRQEQDGYVRMDVGSSGRPPAEEHQKPE